MQDFCRKLPSFLNGTLTFTMTANKDGKIRYQDGANKNNPYIREVFPKIYHVDTERRLEQLQSDLLLLQEHEILKQMRSGWTPSPAWSTTASTKTAAGRAFSIP